MKLYQSGGTNARVKSVKAGNKKRKVTPKVVQRPSVMQGAQSKVQQKPVKKGGCCLRGK